MEKAVKQIDPEDYSPTAWAYIGDAYYELAMRVLTMQEGPRKMSQMHEATSRFVRASFQAKGYYALEDMLTHEEQEIFRRARNQKAGQVPKSASVAEYRSSTGIEGLVGYLYLTGREDRAREILIAMRGLQEEEKNASNATATHARS